MRLRSREKERERERTPSRRFFDIFQLSTTIVRRSVFSSRSRRFPRLCGPFRLERKQRDERVYARIFLLAVVFHRPSLPAKARISALTYLPAAKRRFLAPSRSQPTIANKSTGCWVIGFADVSRRRRQFCEQKPSRSPPTSVFLRGGSRDARDPMHRDPFRCVLLPSIRGRVG